MLSIGIPPRRRLIDLRPIVYGTYCNLWITWVPLLLLLLLLPRRCHCQSSGHIVASFFRALTTSPVLHFHFIGMDFLVKEHSLFTRLLRSRVLLFFFFRRRRKWSSRVKTISEKSDDEKFCWNFFLSGELSKKREEETIRMIFLLENIIILFFLKWNQNCYLRNIFHGRQK